MCRLASECSPCGVIRPVRCLEISSSVGLTAYDTSVSVSTIPEFSLGGDWIACAIIKYTKTFPLLAHSWLLVYLCSKRHIFSLHFLYLSSSSPFSPPPSATLIPLHNVSLLPSSTYLNTHLLHYTLSHHSFGKKKKNWKDDCLPPQAETIMSISLAHISESDFVFFFYSLLPSWRKEKRTTRMTTTRCGWINIGVNGQLILTIIVYFVSFDRYHSLRIRSRKDCTG